MMQFMSVEHARILIVDDQEANIQYLERTLRRAGFSELTMTQDSRQVLDLYHAQNPDLIILDLMMPHLDGFAVMEQLSAVVPAGDYLPILVLTADATAETQRRALAAGVADFLTKPFHPIEVTLRTRNLLRTRLLHRALQQENEALEQKVRSRTQALADSQVEILERLAISAEYRDDQTGRHAQRVGAVSAALAREIGLPLDQVTLIRQAAPLHDVGKIGIPDDILGKPGRLTPEEYEQMKVHTTIGGRILSGGQSPLIHTAQSIALSHHEWWNGHGYPHHLIGEQIPLAGRIVAVADVLDALTHVRPYKTAWPLAAALDELGRLSGQQFDPDILTALQFLHHRGHLELEVDPPGNA